MPDTNPREHARADRGVTIVLSTPFVERIGEEGLAAYAAAISDLAAMRDHSVGDLADAFRERLDAAGIQLPETSYQRTAEQIHGARGTEVSLATDSGRVLFGDPEATAPEKDPDVEGTEDPDHPDRPAYS